MEKTFERHLPTDKEIKDAIAVVHERCAGIDGDSTRQAMWFLYGKRDKDGYFKAQSVEYVDRLTTEQLQKKKHRTYLKMANHKANMLASNPEKQMVDFHSVSGDEEKHPRGAISVPDTDIILSCSGFLQKRDECFVLSMAVYLKLMSIEEVDDIAAYSANELYFANREKLTGYTE